MLLYFKSIIQLFAIIGVVLAFLELFGVFSDDDRISFFRLIETENECSPDHPGAQKFLKSFVVGQPDIHPIPLSEITAITIHAIGYGPESSDDATIMSGYLVLKNAQGKFGKKICSIEELREWSRQTPFWRWFAWSMIAVSTFLGTIVLIFEPRPGPEKPNDGQEIVNQEQPSPQS